MLRERQQQTNNNIENFVLIVDEIMKAKEKFRLITNADGSD